MNSGLEEKVNSPEGHKERLRERYFQDGLEGFHDYEVLELILSYILVRIDTKPLAKELLDRFKTVPEVLNADPKELIKIKGLNKRSALFLNLIKDAGSFSLKQKIFNKEFISCSNDVYNYLKFLFKADKDEAFQIVYLNNQNNILGTETLFKGTKSESAVYVRKIVEMVIQNNASSVIIAHNHPSGSMKPSDADMKITHKVYDSLKLIDVVLLDHLIIGDNEYFSFKAEGLL